MAPTLLPDTLLDALRDNSLTAEQARQLYSAVGGLVGDVNRLEAELDECTEHRQLHAQVHAALTRLRTAEASVDTLRGSVAALEGQLRSMRQRLADAEAGAVEWEAIAATHRHVEPMSARTLLPGAPDLDAGAWANALALIDKLTSGGDPDDCRYFAQEAV